MIGTMIWVLVWVSAPEGPRNLLDSGYVYKTYDECQQVADNPPASGQFRCELHAR